MPLAALQAETQWLKELGTENLQLQSPVRHLSFWKSIKKSANTLSGPYVSFNRVNLSVRHFFWFDRDELECRVPDPRRRISQKGTGRDGNGNRFRDNKYRSGYGSPAFWVLRGLHWRIYAFLVLSWVLHGNGCLFVQNPKERANGRVKNMKEIDLKIRNERKSSGWFLKQMAEKVGIYNGPQNLDSEVSYTWEIKGGGPSGTNAKEVSAFI